MTRSTETRSGGGPPSVDHEAETVLAERIPDRPVPFGGRFVRTRHFVAAGARGPLEAPRAILVQDGRTTGGPSALGDDPEEN